MLRGRMILLSALLSLALIAEDRPEAAFDSHARQRILEVLGTRLEGSLDGNWEGLLAEWEPRLARAKTEAAYYKTLNRMLRSAGKSHFMLVSPALVKARDNQQPTDPAGTIGIRVEMVNGQAIIIRQEPGAPPSLRPGDRILQIGNWSPAALIRQLHQSQLPPMRQRNLFRTAVANRLAGPVGSRFRLRVETNAGRQKDFWVTRYQVGGEILQLGHLPPWRMHFEKRWLADQRIGYIRFNVFMMPLLKQIDHAIREYQDAHAIILDLRGNPGGLGLMAVPVASRFCSIKRSLGTSRLRESTVHYTVLPADNPFTGHLVILVDEQTASTSEILAGGLQEGKRAIVVGRPTMGAVLPSLIVRLPGGAQMQYPIGNYQTAAGKSLEGVGVKPDVRVDLTRRALYKGPDPVLATAVEFLLQSPERAAPTAAETHSDDARVEAELPVRKPFPKAVKVLLQRQVEAMGGDAYRKLTSLEADGVLAIPGTGLRGEFSLLAKVPDRVRLEVRIPGFGVLLQGYDGRIGWSVDPVLGHRRLTPEETAFTRQTASLSLAADFRRHFRSAERLPSIKWKRHRCEVVRFQQPGAPPLTVFFDQDSGRVVRQETGLKGPLGVYQIATDLSNFRRFGDVRVPCRLDIRSGDLEVALLITDVTLNGAIDEKRFAQPPTPKP